MTSIVGNISLVLDIGLLIVGAWTLVKGALPARLLIMFLGKGNYQTDTRTARLFGSLLAIPFAGYFIAIIWTTMVSEQVAIIISIIHLVLFLMVILTTVTWARHIRIANKASE